MMTMMMYWMLFITLGLVDMEGRGEKLILTSRLDAGLSCVVIVNGIVVAFCHSLDDAVIIARLYEERPSRPVVRVAYALVRFGRAYIPDWEERNE